MRVAHSIVRLILALALVTVPASASADLRDTAERAARAAAASLKPHHAAAPQVVRPTPSPSTALVVATLRGAVLAPAEARRARASGRQR
jgi:hypothetical protein